MRKQLSISAILLGLLLTSGLASAYTINDMTFSLEGHSRSTNNNGWADVVGNPVDFEVFGVNISRSGGQITFDLFTNVNPGAMKLSTSSGDYYYYLADFAIDANRDGVFEYGVVLKDHDLWTGLRGAGVGAGGTGSHDVGLYSGASWRDSSYFNEEATRSDNGGVGYGEKYANGSAVLDPVIGVDTYSSFKSLTLTTANNGGDGSIPRFVYSFTLADNDLGLDQNSLGPAIFWGGATCANDAIEGAPVPEPASMLLLSTGLVGLAGVKRRAKQRA